VTAIYERARVRAEPAVLPRIAVNVEAPVSCIIASTSHGGRLKPLSILLCSLALVGCYRNVPVEGISVANGTRVIVDLTSTGSATLRPSIGDFVTRVEGDVTESNSNGMTLSLFAVRRRGDVAPSSWTGEQIRLSRDDIAQVQRAELSRARTTVASIALGAVGVGLVYVIARATGLVSGSGGGRIPPTP
jgi:hypothetical protein